MAGHHADLNNEAIGMLNISWDQNGQDKWPLSDLRSFIMVSPFISLDLANGLFPSLIWCQANCRNPWRQKHGANPSPTLEIPHLLLHPHPYHNSWPTLPSTRVCSNVRYLNSQLCLSGEPIHTHLWVCPLPSNKFPASPLLCFISEFSLVMMRTRKLWAKTSVCSTKPPQPPPTGSNHRP